jgi:hypothetical protein
VLRNENGDLFCAAYLRVFSDASAQEHGLLVKYGLVNDGQPSCKCHPCEHVNAFALYSGGFNVRVRESLCRIWRGVDVERVLSIDQLYPTLT